MLRFTLAYLYVASGAKPSTKWLFDSFWRAATEPEPEKEHERYLKSYYRSSGATTAMNGICRALGMEPTAALFEKMAEAREKG